MVRCIKFLMLSFCFLASAWVTAGEKVTLTSLDWPPYTGDALKDQGASVAVAKAAFAAVGYDLVVEFYPWRRAVNLAKESPSHDGYFPEYYAEELKQDFILSEPMGSGPLGFAELTSSPIQWASMNDLTQIKIGVVSGYVNTAEFDDMAAKGQIKTSAASDDVKNLQKLLGGRINAAVVDKNVLAYLMSTTPELASAKGKIQFNGKMLEDKQLYICFKKGPRGEKLAKALSDGLKKIDVQAIMSQYF